MKTFKNIKKIEIKDLSFKYDGIPVLKDLNVEFESGKLIVIMGPNGAGKTTLFKLIDLLLTPQKGKILADGHDIFEFSKKERMEWRKNMGFVFQEPFLLNSSVWKNLAYPLSLRKIPKDEIKEKVDKLIAQSGLEKVSKKKPHQLSGGDKKRVAFAQTIITDPKILLLDEPTASVDPENSILLEDMINKMKKPGIFILMSTHNLFQSKRLADDVGFMHKGNIIEFGTKDEIFEAPSFPITSKFIKGEISL
ncbi:MAG: ABC transporter ATP-binding protein [Candidatus Hodarchaeota archaeon]